MRWGRKTLFDEMGKRQRITSYALILFLAMCGFFVQDKSVSSVAAEPALLKPRLFIHYQAKKGESLDDISKHFSVDAETIIWSNELGGNAFFAGGEGLLIPPTSGIVYTANAGDTYDSLALIYKVKISDLEYWNNGRLIPGEPLIIPGVHYPPHALTASKNQQGLPALNLKQIGGHIWGSGTRYPDGWCTTWVYVVGGAIPWNGNANMWPIRAAEAGWGMGKTAKVGSMYAEPWYSPWGHISLVVATNADGSFIVSEQPTFGLGNPSYRIVPQVDPRATFIYYPEMRV